MKKVNLDDVLIAQPNLSNLTAEVQVEVANSPAFQCLEHNFYFGNITGTEVALLKLKYAHLYEALTRTRDNEYNLLQTSKRFIAALEVQNAELLKSDQFPENVSTNVSRLRRDHLRTVNTLMAVEERVEKFIYKTEVLKNEKRLLQREYSRMPKQELDNLGDEDIIEAMHRRTKALTLENQEMHIEIDKMKRERHKMSENLRVLLEQEQETKDARNQVSIEIDTVKSDLFNISQLPGQYSKEYEKLRKYKIDGDKELAQEQENFAHLQEIDVDLIKNIEGIDNDIVEMKAKIVQTKKEKNDVMNMIVETDRSIKTFHGKEMENRMDKAAQELRLQSLGALKKEYTETILKTTRDKEKLQKLYKTTLLHFNVLNESLYQLKQVYEKVLTKYMNFPRDDTTFYDRRNRLHDEVVALKASLEEEVTKETVVISKVNLIISDAERRLGNLNNQRSECVELVKLAQKVAVRREKAANDHFNTQRRYQKVQDELTSKMDTLTEQKKSLELLANRAASVAKLYSAAKMERNKCVALLQLTSQDNLQKKEKLRLATNEQSINHKYLFDRHAYLMDTMKRKGALVMERDNLRNDICRYQSQRIDLTYKREVMRLSIQRLNNMFNKIEADIIQMKKLTEKNIQFRNERAMQLIERNEDVYILDERTKIQDSRYRDAQIELQYLIERGSCMRRYKTELISHIEMLKRQVPVYKNFQHEGESLTKECQAEENRCSDLVRRVEDPDSKGRIRFLKGKDLDAEDLQKKVDTVEKRLVNKEERLLEKDLLFEAVSRLVDQVQLRSVIGKSDTIKVAKRINHLKSRILNVDKQLKTYTAMMTIKISESHKLKTEVESNNVVLNRKYDRFEHRLTPSLEIKKEYNRKLTHKNIREDYKKNKNRIKKINPKPQKSRLWLNYRAAEYRLPPISKVKTSLKF